MDAFLVHDEDGNISSLGIPEREFQGQLRLVPEKGELVTELNIPEDDSALVERFLVDVEGRRLVPKDKGDQ